MGKWEGDFFSQPVLPRKSTYAGMALTELSWLIKNQIYYTAKTTDTKL